jgi:hypothetical protein
MAEAVASEALVFGATKLLEESITNSRQLSHELSPAVLHPSSAADKSTSFSLDHFSKQYNRGVVPMSPALSVISILFAGGGHPWKRSV